MASAQKRVDRLRFWFDKTPEQREAWLVKIQAARNSGLKSGKSWIERVAAAWFVEQGTEHYQQYRIGRYWVDFYLPEFNAVVECDGEYWHSSEEAKRRDAVRDKEIKRAGFSVIRVSGKSIRSGVFKDQILTALLKLRASACAA